MNSTVDKNGTCLDSDTTYRYLRSVLVLNEHNDNYLYCRNFDKLSSRISMTLSGLLLSDNIMSRLGTPRIENQPQARSTHKVSILKDLSYVMPRLLFNLHL